MYNSLLISEPPLQVLPSLAVKIGLNEAIILQQFHYWLQRSKNIQEGRKWIYNSIPEWNKQFPFWSESTLKRAIRSLKKQNLIITGNFNKAKFDKTSWYSIDYVNLKKLENNQNIDEPVNLSSGQNDLTSDSKWTDASVQNEPTYTNRLPENTHETTNKQQTNKANVFELYESNFRKLNSFQRDQFIDYIEQLNPEIVELAIKKICLTDSLKNTWGSFDYLVKDWINHNLHTTKDIIQYENDRKKDIKDKKAYKNKRQKNPPKYQAGDSGYREMAKREENGDFPF